jgi:tetratricopeptide (TPR) repeat protein/transcriptional regulator with XRE-family HTH domain
VRANDGEDFGTLLRRYRLAAMLTQEKLSGLTGISTRSISSMEAGRTTRPRLGSVGLIADALELAQESRDLLIRLGRGTSEVASPVPAGRPAQVPADIAEFTDRTEQVKVLTELLAPAGQSVRIAVVTGPGGVGKSALAIHVAHRLVEEFGDGQLFVELQGSSGQPAATSDLLARMLRQLGMADEAIPADVTERAAEFRTRMASRAMLLVLDDARDAAQIRPLMPGSASSAVIVTSRGWLAELEGSRALALGSLADPDAFALFASICGPGRVAQEPEATDQVLAACGGLPLAIRIAAARLVSRPAWDVATLASRLRDERQRLSELAIGDLAIRASFAVSYATLPACADPARSAGRAFRLLGLWPGADLSLPAAAALLGITVESASEVLERLVDVHLLETPAAHQYRFHDLIAVFAAECAQEDEPLVSREQAITRLLLWYLHTTERALTELEIWSRDGFSLIPVSRAEGEMTPLDFASHDIAARWCDRERANVVTAVTLAARHGLHDLCSQLAESAWLSFMRSPWGGWIQVLEHGLASASAIGDHVAQAWLHTYLGIALITLHGEPLAAIDHFDQALPLGQAAGDRQCEAIATANLGIAYKMLERYDDAIASLERALLILSGTKRERGVILMNLGSAYLEAGQLDLGTERMEEALATIGNAGDPRGASLGQSLLADAYRQLGRLAEAISSAELALEISQRVHDEYHEATAWYTLGQVRAELGEVDQARSCLSRAFELADRLRVPEAEWIAASLAALDGADRRLFRCRALRGRRGWRSWRRVGERTCSLRTGGRPMMIPVRTGRGWVMSESRWSKRCGVRG